MLVSWNWLKDYVNLDMPLAELENRLAMSGLNHEGTRQLGDDLVIDLEVTSNRPDCLGHLGVAREIAVLWQQLGGNRWNLFWSRSKYVRTAKKFLSYN